MQFVVQEIQSYEAKHPVCCKWITLYVQMGDSCSFVYVVIEFKAR